VYFVVSRIKDKIVCVCVCHVSAILDGAFPYIKKAKSFLEEITGYSYSWNFYVIISKQILTSTKKCNTLYMSYKRKRQKLVIRALPIQNVQK